jgi:hypothetical protein
MDEDERKIAEDLLSFAIVYKRDERTYLLVHKKTDRLFGFYLWNRTPVLVPLNVKWNDYFCWRTHFGEEEEDFDISKVLI